MATTTIAGTTSQQASAELHLERRSEWRYYRIEGVRYVAIPSARSGKVYRVRSDGAGCDCTAYQVHGYAVCSHMIAVRRSNERPAVRPVRARFEDVFGVCDVVACDEDRARGERYCDRHVVVSAFG